MTNRTQNTATLQIVWFKRDLRVDDHRALAEAAASGPVLPLFVVEPELWRQPDMSARQWAFVCECLRELQAALAALGQPLVIRVGRVTEVLEDELSEIKEKNRLSSLDTPAAAK